MSRVILYHATLPERLAAGDVAALGERIPYAKRVALGALRDRECSVVGLALALAAASAVAGRPMTPETLRFVPGERPVFEVPGAPVFSITHSGRTVAAAATVRGRVGLDIERREESGLDDVQRSEWSAREAVAKTLGLGLRAAIDVELARAPARLRGIDVWLQPIALGPDAGWLATDFAAADLEVRTMDAVGELRRYAA